MSNCIRLFSRCRFSQLALSFHSWRTRIVPSNRRVLWVFRECLYYLKKSTTSTNSKWYNYSLCLLWRFTTRINHNIVQLTLIITNLTLLPHSVRGLWKLWVFCLCKAFLDYRVVSSRKRKLSYTEDEECDSWKCIRTRVQKVKGVLVKWKVPKVLKSFYFLVRIIIGCRSLLGSVKHKLWASSYISYVKPGRKLMILLSVRPR